MSFVFMWEDLLMSFVLMWDFINLNLTVYSVLSVCELLLGLA